MRTVTNLPYRYGAVETDEGKAKQTGYPLLVGKGLRFTMIEPSRAKELRDLTKESAIRLIDDGVLAIVVHRAPLTTAPPVDRAIRRETENECAFAIYVELDQERIESRRGQGCERICRGELPMTLNGCFAKELRKSITSRSGCRVLPPNGSRLSCGAVKKDSFLNLRAPAASSAC